MDGVDKAADIGAIIVDKTEYVFIQVLLALTVVEQAAPRLTRTERRTRAS